MPIALALALTIALQDIPTHRWASHVQMDDFTDELSGVAAAVKSKDRNSTVFPLICKDRILTAAIIFPRAYLGDGFGSVRWRIDRLDHGEGKWIRDGRTGRYFHNLDQNFDDLGARRIKLDATPEEVARAMFAAAKAENPPDPKATYAKGIIRSSCQPLLASTAFGSQQTFCAVRFTKQLLSNQTCCLRRKLPDVQAVVSALFVSVDCESDFAIISVANRNTTAMNRCFVCSDARGRIFAPLLHNISFGIFCASHQSIGQRRTIVDVKHHLTILRVRDSFLDPHIYQGSFS